MGCIPSKRDATAEVAFFVEIGICAANAERVSEIVKHYGESEEIFQEAAEALRGLHSNGIIAAELVPNLVPAQSN